MITSSRPKQNSILLPRGFILAANRFRCRSLRSTCYLYTHVMVVGTLRGSNWTLLYSISLDPSPTATVRQRIARGKSPAAFYNRFTGSSGVGAFFYRSYHVSRNEYCMHSLQCEQCNSHTNHLSVSSTETVGGCCGVQYLEQRSWCLV